MDIMKILVVLFVAFVSIAFATKGGGMSSGSYYPSYDYQPYGQPYASVPIYSPEPVSSYAVQLPQYESNYEFEGLAPIQRYVEVQQMQYMPSYGGGGGYGGGMMGGYMGR